MEEALAEIARGLPGVKIDTPRLPAACAIRGARQPAPPPAAGAILLVVAGALLRSWRGTIVLIAGVALSLLATVTVLHVAGITLNMMILGLLVALAVVIGEVIVDVDRIMGRLRSGTGNPLSRSS